MVKFGEVVKNANLVERDPEANGIERIVGLEHIDPENLHIRRWNAVADGTSFSRKFVPGQTLFGKRRAYQRKVAYAEFEGICSGDILTFEPKSNEVLLSELLPFICQSDAFFDHALDTSAGSLSPRTSWTALKDFEFPLPPLNEQKSIAEILWAADEVVESYVDVSQKEKVVEERIKIELTQKGNQKHRFKDTEIGKFPENWKIVTIRDLVINEQHSLLAGPFGTIFKAKDFREEGVPIIQLRHISEEGFSWGDKNTYMDFAVYEKLHKPYTVQPGDFLLTKLGDPPGVACLYPSDMPPGMVTPDVVRAKLNRDVVLPEYLLMFFNNAVTRKRLMQLTKGGTRPRVSLDELFKLKIPLPPIDEQASLIQPLTLFRKNKSLRESARKSAKMIMNGFFGKVSSVNPTETGNV